jgi:sulfur carrier protein
MKLRVNGEEREYDGEPRLAALLREIGIDPAAPGVAVAVNARVVPRQELESAGLSDGDRVEIVRAVQGG